MEVTATLEDWVYDKKQKIIIGRVFNDVKERWEDGTRITTSRLLPMSMQVSSPKEGVVVNTLNSSYLLGNNITKKKEA